jgi:hypothetical protein
MLGTLDVDQRTRRQHARLDVGTDRDDHRDGVGNTELAQRAFVRGVGLGDVGEELGVLLHALLVGVDAEHLVAHVDQRRRERRAEAAQPDHDDLAVVDDVGTQPTQHGVEDVVSQ